MFLVVLAAAAAPGGVGAQPAIHPVLDARSGYLLGARVNGAWRGGPEIAPRVRAGRRYRVFGPAGELGVATGGRAESDAEGQCEDLHTVQLAPRPEAGEIAIDAPWAVIPRRVARLSAAAAAGYNGAVREIVARHGIRNPEARVTGALRVDLDGDGTEEVIVSAHRETAGGGMQVGAGDYAVLFVRKLVNGSVRTIILAEEYHPRAKGGTTPYEYSIAGVYDLDGDGVSEIMIRGRYYHGGSIEVYGLRGTTKQRLLGEGCGN
ncbi:MAG TPA: hypothetical protein VFS20_30100 [Longimicrobium sp.]|nr:hypothetical protein [Longimicrobium sp.]